MCSNATGAEGAWYISEALRANTVLTHLYIANNDIRDEGAWYLCESLTGGTAAGGGAAASAAPGTVRSAVTTLYMGGNSIRNEGANHIAALLRSPNSSVTTIDVQTNKIGNRGAVAIASAMPLTVTAYLGGNRVSQEQRDLLLARMKSNVGSEENLHL